jgi:outer membrane protein TolC
LNVIASQQVFDMQYKPQLNLFVNSGLVSHDFQTIPKHLGMSAGLSFTWLLYDGKQRKSIQRQNQFRINTIAIYRDEFINKNELRKNQYITELKSYDKRRELIIKQLSGYKNILDAYQLELPQGQISVIDYLNVLRSQIQLKKDYMLLQINRQSLINAFNYWNW